MTNFVLPVSGQAHQEEQGKQHTLEEMLDLLQRFAKRVVFDHVIVSEDSKRQIANLAFTISELLGHNSHKYLYPTIGHDILPQQDWITAYTFFLVSDAILETNYTTSTLLPHRACRALLENPPTQKRLSKNLQRLLRTTGGLTVAADRIVESILTRNRPKLAATGILAQCISCLPAPRKKSALRKILMNGYTALGLTQEIHYSDLYRTLHAPLDQRLKEHQDFQKLLCLGSAYWPLISVEEKLVLLQQATDIFTEIYALPSFSVTCEEDTRFSQDSEANAFLRHTVTTSGEQTNTVVFKPDTLEKMGYFSVLSSLGHELCHGTQFYPEVFEPHGKNHRMFSDFRAAVVTNHQYYIESALDKKAYRVQPVEAHAYWYQDSFYLLTKEIIRLGLLKSENYIHVATAFQMAARETLEEISNEISNAPALQQPLGSISASEPNEITNTTIARAARQAKAHFVGGNITNAMTPFEKIDYIRWAREQVAIYDYYATLTDFVGSTPQMLPKPSPQSFGPWSWLKRALTKGATLHPQRN